MSMDEIAKSLAASGQPDMTRPQFVRLGAATHGRLRFRPAPDYFFAGSASMTPIVAAELSLAALNYPLAFLPREDTVELVGLLTIEEGRNLFVSASGAWLADCVPASVCTYPFRYQSGGKGGRPALFADMGSGLLSSGETEEGERLFDEEGRPSAKMREIVAALKAYEKSRRLTQKVCGQIRQAGLLVPWAEGGMSNAMHELMRVDEPRLGKLSLPELHALRQSGALLLVYAHLVSLAGLPRLARLAKVHAATDRQRRQFLESCFRIDPGIEDSFKF